MEESEGLKKLLAGKKYIYGLEEAKKALKIGEVESVLLACNCQERVKQYIRHYASICKCKVIELDMPSEEVGVAIKRAHPIAVICITKKRLQ